MNLPNIEFPIDKVKLNPIFKNNYRLADIKKMTSKVKVPRKVLEGYGAIYFPEAPVDRPYIYSSMILSLDGKIAFEKEEKSSNISKGNFLDLDGGLADLWLLNVLRTYTDGIVFGTKTLCVEENITGHIYDEELAKERVTTLGKKQPIPWNIVITRTGKKLPLKHKIFNHKEIPLCIATTPEGFSYLMQNIDREYVVLSKNSNKEQLTQEELLSDHKILFIVTGQEKTINHSDMLYLFKSIGIERLLIESPTIMYNFMKEKVLDEAFVNYSGIYVGGSISLGYNQPFDIEAYPTVDILSIHLHEPSFLYTRQKFIYSKLKE